MPVAGAEAVAKNITTFGGGFLKHVKKVMVYLTEDLDREVTKNMSVSDHTQKDLTALGHPYAAKHGPHGMPIHDPYWQVHNQSGKLLKSKEHYVVGPEVKNGQLSVKGSVKLNEVDVEYAVYLIWGTSKMIPRDFLTGSINDDAFQRRTGTYLKTNLRDMVLNFKGVETE